MDFRVIGPCTDRETIAVGAKIPRPAVPRGEVRDQVLTTDVEHFGRVPGLELVPLEDEA